VTLVGGVWQSLGERTSHGLPFGHGIEAVKVGLKCGSFRLGRDKEISHLALPGINRNRSRSADLRHHPRIVIQVARFFEPSDIVFLDQTGKLDGLRDGPAAVGIAHMTLRMIHEENESQRTNALLGIAYPITFYA